MNELPSAPRPENAAFSGSGSSPGFGDEAVFHRQELVRVMLKSLHCLGYKDAAGALERESGVPLCAPQCSRLCTLLGAGQWDDALLLLPAIKFAPLSPTLYKGKEDKLDKMFGKHTSTKAHQRENDATKMAEAHARFLIMKQCYLEALEQSRLDEALETLRERITPLHPDVDEVHHLASLVLCSDSTQLLAASAPWDGAGGKSRHQLLDQIQRLICPSQVLHEDRLQTLLVQAMELQASRCPFHACSWTTATGAKPSLYQDHSCTRRSLLPAVTVETLEAHTDEVWFVCFSRKGDRMASASADKSIAIWAIGSPGTTSQSEPPGSQSPSSLNATGGRDPIHWMKDLDSPPTYLAWSPDDGTLLSCGESPSISAWNTHTGDKIREFTDGHTDDVTAVAWLPGGLCFISGGMDKAVLIWDLDSGEVLCRWADSGAGPRVRDLAVATWTSSSSAQASGTGTGEELLVPEAAETSDPSTTSDPASMADTDNRASQGSVVLAVCADDRLRALVLEVGESGPGAGHRTSPTPPTTQQAPPRAQAGTRTIGGLRLSWSSTAAQEGSTGGNTMSAAAMFMQRSRSGSSTTTSSSPSQSGARDQGDGDNGDDQEGEDEEVEDEAEDDADSDRRVVERLLARHQHRITASTTTTQPQASSSSSSSSSLPFGGSLVNTRRAPILGNDGELSLVDCFEESFPSAIMSLCLAADGRHALLALEGPELWLWELRGRRVVQRYSGHRRTRFVLRPCFGGGTASDPGAPQDLVLCGSEDSQVYVWARESGELLTVLPGHSGTINAVAWAPSPQPLPPQGCESPQILMASASDDYTVRLWGPAR